MNEVKKNKRQPPIVTGLATFDKVVHGEAFYVDKTLFVKDVFDSGSESTLILRPRRWGKSLNLAMLKYFLEAPLKEGAEQPGEVDLEKLEEKKHFFKDKRILLEHPQMEEHLGKYTVLSLSLSGFEVKNDEEFFQIIRHKVAEVFHSFRSLSSSLQESERNFFDLFSKGQAGRGDLSQALSFLSPILARVYKHPIFLLLDEYDSAVNSVWEKALKKRPGADELLEQLVGFFGSFYESSVKLNTYVYRTIFTGVFRVLKGSVGTSMNNFQEYSSLDECFDRDFGFTQEEILSTLHELGIPASSHAEKLKEASEWYNGYHSTAGPLYNPWSIMYWLKQGRADAYWVNMGSLDIILAISQYHVYTEELSQLALGKTVEGNILWGLVLRQCGPNSERLKDAFWTLLAFSGYVSIERRVQSLGDQITCELRIPNQELLQYFRGCLISDFSYRHHFSTTEVRLWIQELLEGDWKSFEKKLKDFLRKVVSSFDVGENKIEAFYQGFFIGLIAHCENFYFIRSEFPTGKGRGDLLLIPRSEKISSLALLIEYKVGENSNELAQLAKEALDRVLARDYHAEVENHSHVTDSLSLGLSFYGKDFCLEKKTWKK